MGKKKTGRAKPMVGKAGVPKKDTGNSKRGKCK